jgi:small subunit ribosomal protein S17
VAEEPENTPEDETTSDAPAPEAESAPDAPTSASASDADLASEEPTSDDEAEPEDEAPAEPEPEAPAEPAPSAAEPAEALTPKQRRQRERAAKAAATPVRPQRSPDERQAERDAERRRKAQVRSARRKREREKARAGRDGAATTEPRREQHPGKQKTRQGVVVSDRATKTIVVRIDVARRHPRYEKIVRTSRTLHAHDEREDAHIGDTVIVRESRPISRTKRWRLVEVVERAQ